MYNNLRFIGTTLSFKRLLLVSVCLLTQACSHTSSIWAQDTLLEPNHNNKENHHPTAPNNTNNTNIASTNGDSLVIYVYPQSGPINKGKYYRLYHRKTIATK